MPDLNPHLNDQHITIIRTNFNHEKKIFTEYLEINKYDQNYKVFKIQQIAELAQRALKNMNKTLI